jgi:hypothetical protein
MYGLANYLLIYIDFTHSLEDYDVIYTIDRLSLCTVLHSLQGS